MSEPDVYEVTAVKYAHNERAASGSFMHSDDIHDTEATLDFFVWACVSENRTFVVDTGYNQETAERRGRVLIRCPGEGLKLIGIDPTKVE